ncbi:hypothetical protein P43SY_002865 [Pythium insidiosum]|uniref:Arrestin-like N-terminal domain-containing protein n=1 Tax=Pythium insidiosum TaxID=114742 RepID=A0AAD5LT67_PYTIN|nr:hypothetical protein P43SY_002865 [Pythium insidiosum]
MQDRELGVILLDEIYTPGEIVSGQVILSLPSEAVCASLVVEIIGEERVQWEDWRDLRDISVSKSHSRVLHLSAHSVTLGPVQLETGTHVFPFAVPLATHLPGSLRHQVPYAKQVEDVVITVTYRAQAQ